MPRKVADPYEATRKARAVVHSVTITFAHGRELTDRMDLSIRQIEQMYRNGDITADVLCNGCGEHVIDCPKIGRYLVEWPAGWSWRDRV